MKSHQIALAVFLSLAGSPAVAADAWVIPTDTALAIRDPDRFAWHLFVALTWPADVDARAPATAKPHGSEGPVMFETWALSTQAYLPNGARPPEWDVIPWADPRTLSKKPVPRQIALFRQVEPVPPGDGTDQNEEVRMNRATFDYVRDHGLYSIEGQQRFFYAGTPVAFPTDAIEVKAVWRPIAESDKPRYQWAAMKDAATGKTFIYGLTALHVASKVLPRWHWSTFEHVDNRFRNGLHDEGWLNPSRDSVACPPGNLDCGVLPAGFGLDGTRWENYRLRGSQVAYADRMGNPIILANSELETGFQQSASCMSCHGRSSIGPNKNPAAPFEFGPDAKAHPPVAPEPMRLDVFTTLPTGEVVSFNGPPTPDQFKLPGQAVGGTATYLPLDFVWSFLEANSELPPVKK